MLTNPSHASIMTSLYPRDHGVYDNRSGLDQGMRTVAATLRKNGFQTGAIIGFPHLNPEVSNLGQGFAKIIRATRQERKAKVTSQLALKMIDSFDRSNFFLWLHYTEPHAPYAPAQNKKSRLRFEELRRDMPATPIQKARRAAPRFQRKNKWFQHAFSHHRFVEDLTAKYLMEIEAVDRGLGVLLRGLEQRDLNDVLFVLTSDHGENLGEHELYFHHGGVYRQSSQVPLIVSAPGLGQRRVAELVSTLDIAPTILDFAGLSRWEPMRGSSLRQRHREPAQHREWVYTEHYRGELLAARNATATMIVHRKSSKQFPSYKIEQGTRELFDRRQDPDEMSPLALDHELAPQFEQSLANYINAGMRMSAYAPIGQDEHSLQALGYLE